MNPDDYNADELRALMKQLSRRELKKSLKAAYRREAADLRDMATASLRSSGLQVQGDSSDWEEGVRTFIYTGGGGFMVTVKPHGNVGKGIHTNRYGRQKPVLMWAEEGTQSRKTVGRRGRKGHDTGSMPGYHFLTRIESQMRSHVEATIGGQLDIEVRKTAKKCGFE